MTAYYNEIDRSAAAWLRELISQGLIAQGEVDERDIRDVTPNDLRGFTQCHFFAGIGTWSYALRKAQWPDGREVWTGSPPCQPFSAAGRRKGTADERHLWPHYHHLIRICRPGEIFIEQVSSKDGLAWLDLVQADLEGEDYAYWALDCCAAGVGAPHIRQRQYGVGRCLEGVEYGEGNRWFERWTQSGGGIITGGCITVGLDHSVGSGLEEHGRHGDRTAGRTIEDRPVAETGTNDRLADSKCLEREWGRASEEGVESGSFERPERLRDADRLADDLLFERPDSQRKAGVDDEEFRWFESTAETSGHGLNSGVGDPERKRSFSSPHSGIYSREKSTRPRDVQCERSSSIEQLADDSSEQCGEMRPACPRSEERTSDGGAIHRTHPDNGFWRNADWIFCRDGKFRPVESGTQPLVNGAPARVGRLRGYGNGIVAEQAQAFIESYLEAEIAGFDVDLVDCSLDELLS